MDVLYSPRRYTTIENKLYKFINNTGQEGGTTWCMLPFLVIGRHDVTSSSYVIAGSVCTAGLVVLWKDLPTDLLTFALSIFSNLNGR